MITLASIHVEQMSSSASNHGWSLFEIVALFTDPLFFVTPLFAYQTCHPTARTTYTKSSYAYIRNEYIFLLPWY